MSSKGNSKSGEAMTSRLPPDTDQKTFKHFLWNPKTQTVLGRSGASWAKIGLFYIVFYSFLAAFFSVMMAVFYKTLNYEAPKYTGADSLLNNPGLGIRPHIISDDDLRPTVTYQSCAAKSYSPYVNSIQKHWDLYMTRSSNARSCSPNVGYLGEDDSVCYFDVYDLNSFCTPAKLWGYNSTSPCILLKLNKMFHWKPEPIESLYDLPKDLQQHINTSGNAQELLKQNIWIWCESEDIEMEQLSPNIPLAYFPYRKQEGYLAPFVVVRLLDLPADQKVKVVCRVWASNVQHKLNLRRTGESVTYFHVN